MLFLSLILGSILAIGIIVAICLRRVVAPNEVHIVQSKKTTMSYGKDTNNGNVYYEFPSCLPIIGITKTVLPVSVFSVNLNNYSAYDRERLPFLVDITAFFRITDTNLAAQRVMNFSELTDQLQTIVQGSIRSILASTSIDQIMLERSKFGDLFTKEVSVQLTNWGVVPVKNIELMDVRDAANEQVIRNIMEKRKSFIEKESRIEVAENLKSAQIAEINAKKETELTSKATEEAIGVRNAKKDETIGVSTQKSNQAIMEQSAVTKIKEMEVIKVAQEKQAEIDKNVQVIKAQQNKETKILISEGDLKSQELLAEGIKVTGEAKADAEKAMNLAPVEAQIVLAKEIGDNANYQEYLITIRQVEAAQAVGMEQAKALTAADIKVIANTGTPSEGVNKVMDLFSANGGSQLNSMLETLNNSEVGKQLLSKVVGTKLEAKK